MNVNSVRSVWVNMHAKVSSTNPRLAVDPVWDSRPVIFLDLMLMLLSVRTHVLETIPVPGLMVS